MKFERISETQIRCTLTSFDLSIRNLNLGELAYGSEKVKGLFSEMMQKASAELGFDPDGLPIMIEAIPLADESIVLEITKVEDPEEVDTRFARFSPFPEEKSFFEQLKANILEAPGPLLKVFSFDALDRIIDAARAVSAEYRGRNSVYKNPENARYYLVLEEEGPDSAIFAGTCNVLAEYGTPVFQNIYGKSYFAEHYEKIVEGNALEVFSGI